MTTYLTISAKMAHAMMNKPDTVILDVREPDEFATGHIPNAVNIPMDALAQALTKEPLKDPDRTILIYCRSGRRSAIAANFLVQCDYENVYDFGGILSWPYEIVYPTKA